MTGFFRLPWQGLFSADGGNYGRGGIRRYLQIVRLPNLFTAPSNVVVGYLTITPLPELNVFSLATLMISSTLLYVSGVVFNDYFDLETDRKERPSRPLPSGTISGRAALGMAIGSMSAAIIIASAVSVPSLIVTIGLSGVIIAYNYNMKRGSRSGPLTMGGARFLNVVLGASQALSHTGRLNFDHTLFAGACIFAYVVAITVLSRSEVSGTSSKGLVIIPFLGLYFIIAASAAATFTGMFGAWDLIILGPLAVIVTLVFKNTLPGSGGSIQSGIKNLVLSIIILDSVFITGTSGPLPGLLNLLLLLPAFLSARYFYVT
ncbi:MAG: UbiA family prenyltransferase [Thaumarchaeota archaeon]|nr:UbiA family prenyltransferase [Nitrososphaerota archaeon]